MKLSPSGWKQHFGRVWRPLLALLLGLSALIGVWFLVVRPSLHIQAWSQIDVTLNQALANTGAVISRSRPGRLNVLIDEKSIAHLANVSDNGQWQVSVTPTQISLRITSCNQSCTFTIALEVVDNNRIQATHVQMEGIAVLVMSNDELANIIEDKLEELKARIHSQVTKIILLEHAIDVQLV